MAWVRSTCRRKWWPRPRFCGIRWDEGQTSEAGSAGRRRFEGVVGNALAACGQQGKSARCAAGKWRASRAPRGKPRGSPVAQAHSAAAPMASPRCPAALGHALLGRAAALSPQLNPRLPGTQAPTMPAGPHGGACPAQLLVSAGQAWQAMCTTRGAGAPAPPPHEHPL